MEHIICENCGSENIKFLAGGTGRDVQCTQCNSIGRRQPRGNLAWDLPEPNTQTTTGEDPNQGVQLSGEN